MSQKGVKGPQYHKKHFLAQIAFKVSKNNGLDFEFYTLTRLFIFQVGIAY